MKHKSETPTDDEKLAMAGTGPDIGAKTSLPRLKRREVRRHRVDASNRREEIRGRNSDGGEKDPSERLAKAKAKQRKNSRAKAWRESKNR